MSDRPRFHAEMNHEFILGRSSDLQVESQLSDSRPSAFPGLIQVAEWKVYSPDYSGGTMPDSHRLPFYALAGTQNI
jgi:hypothetical protein